MIKWGIGEVVNIEKQTEDLQIVTIKYIKGETKAIHYLQFHSPLVIGDQVMINQTATALQLGTGGYDFVVMPLHFQQKEERRELGHIMKLRYTPYQFSVQSCEEQSSKYHSLFVRPKTLEGLPVIIGELHSMLPVIVTVFRQLEINHHQPRYRIVYIMTDGAALPMAISKHVRQLKELGWLNNTITVGQAFGGDLEAVNIYTGLLAAKYVYHADLAVVMMGPGIIGTGTWLGHTGIEQGTIINAVFSLEGIPISVVRASVQDPRSRHQGISHHTISNLEHISLARSIVPYPDYIKTIYPAVYDQLQGLQDKHSLISVPVQTETIKAMLGKYPYSISTMGRTVEEDPLFFDFAASSASWVYNQLVKKE